MINRMISEQRRFSPGGYYQLLNDVVAGIDLSGDSKEMVRTVLRDVQIRRERVII